MSLLLRIKTTSTLVNFGSLHQRSRYCSRACVSFTAQKAGVVPATVHVGAATEAPVVAPLLKYMLDAWAAVETLSITAPLGVPCCVALLSIAMGIVPEVILNRYIQPSCTPPAVVQPCFGTLDWPKIRLSTPLLNTSVIGE